MPPFSLQKTAFYSAKDGLSACERRPFTVPFAVFCKSSKQQ